MRRVSAQLEKELGGQPTQDELSEALEIAAENVARLRSIGLRPESLDAPISDDDLTELGESVPDEQTQTPFELLHEKDFSDLIDRILKTLNKREATIIAERFGLNGTRAKPLEQVAKIIGVIRERVGRLELTALAKLRHAFSKRLDPLEPEVFATASH